jgi:hypothetical protein
MRPVSPRGAGSRGRHAAGAPARRADRVPHAASRHGAIGVPMTSRNRIVPVALLAGIVLSLLLFQYQFRHFEAAAAAHLYGVVTPTLAASSAPIVWFGLGTSGAFGLVITPDCSSALLLAPLGVLGMGLMIPRRLGVFRVSAALAVAATLTLAFHRGGCLTGVPAMKSAPELGR